jgi:hypothetical protein
MNTSAAVTLGIRRKLLIGEKQKIDWSDHGLIQPIGYWSDAERRQRR